MSALIVLLLCLQEPSVAELIRRLDSDQLLVREEAQVALITRGAAALREVEEALAAAKPGEFRIRLARVAGPLRVAEFTEKIPAQFSPAFQEEADLLARLKKAEPGALIEAIAATTGKATHWETEAKRGSHGSVQVRKKIVRTPLAGVTRADAAEVIRLALRAAALDLEDERWIAVSHSARQAIKPAERDDRLRLMPEFMARRDDPSLRGFVMSMIGFCREPEDVPNLLAALDTEDAGLRKRAAEASLYVTPGPLAIEFEKRLSHLEPPLRRFLLYPLKASGDVRFLKTFETYLHSAEGDERTVCHEALQKLAPESLPGHYLKWIRSGDPGRIRIGLRRSLGNPMAPPPKPSPELIEEAHRIYSSTKDSSFRSLAFEILKRGPPEKFKELVMAALGHADPELNLLGIGATRLFKGDDVRKALEKLAEGPHDNVALAALGILMYMPSPPSLDRVRALLKSKVPGVPIGAMRLLANHLREKARDELVPMLDDPDPVIAAEALQLLHWNAKGLEEKIRPFLGSENEHTVLVASRILARLGDKSCLPTIRKGLKTYRFEDYLTCLVLMFEPSWGEILATPFLIPDKDAIGRDVVDGIRKAFTDKGIEVRCELPEEKLGSKFFVPGISPKGWGIGWVRTMIMGSDYFFDGKTLFILPKAEAKKRWREWAEAK